MKWKPQEGNEKNAFVLFCFVLWKVEVMEVRLKEGHTRHTGWVQSLTGGGLWLH